MRYYVYVSDVKIDMLFAQIPRSLLARVAGDLKLDLKLLSVTLKNDTLPETRYSKLDVVTQALREAGEIGVIEQPKQYFSGAMSMGWGPPIFMHHSEERSDKMVLFGGSPDGKSGVALIGSAAHLLGEEGSPVHASYARPAFLQKLADGLLELSEQEIADNEYGTYYAARRIAMFHEGATRPVEFVAKHLLQLRDIVIGSPLYVATQ